MLQCAPDPFGAAGDFSAKSGARRTRWNRQTRPRLWLALQSGGRAANHDWMMVAERTKRPPRGCWTGGVAEAGFCAMPAWSAR